MVNSDLLSSLFSFHVSVSEINKNDPTLIRSLGIQPLPAAVEILSQHSQLLVSAPHTTGLLSNPLWLTVWSVNLCANGSPGLSAISSLLSCRSGSEIAFRRYLQIK